LINLSDDYLLMLEPDRVGKAADIPVFDDITKKVLYLFDLAQPSSYKYKGFHKTREGKCSDSVDYILPNGVITHNLCVYYVQYYRPYIPQTEIDKIHTLYDMFTVI